MKNEKKTELLAGFFLLIGLLSFFYFSVFLGGIELSIKDSYRVTAKFDSVSGLKKARAWR